MTATDHEGFLAAICADPHDVGLRLIYADALDDAGDTARAEFVRVQCELARPDPSHCYAECQQALYGCPQCSKMKDLRQRERELLSLMLDVSTNTHRIREMAKIVWAKPGLGRYVHVWEPIFRRGFVEAISCTCADWLTHGPTIVRCQPVREVKLTDRPEQHLVGQLIASGRWRTEMLDIVQRPITWARGPHPERGLTALLPLEE